ncbi:MAG TPA: hypothetical protein VFR41_14320 [Acidimicrobiia bacterium]|nr:hypothetical protein [Acidimicrobiia bacterium]
MANAEGPATLAIGTEVDVFNRFREGWVGGFDVAEVRDDVYRLRRHADHEVLPAVFKADDVRLSRPPH